ncbi:6668_t:CDS:2 [Rhizophagus irregularis]|nr:6668_t:CDS:2 [Rhizophagus irregularis]
MPPKKQGRKKSPIWLHFIERPLLNSSHHEAKCKYCFGKMEKGGPDKYDLLLHKITDQLSLERPSDQKLLRSPKVSLSLWNS